MTPITLLVILSFGVFEAHTPNLAACEQLGKEALSAAAADGYTGYFMCIGESNEELLG